jgi:hypothetical protein
MTSSRGEIVHFSKSVLRLHLLLFISTLPISFSFSPSSSLVILHHPNRWSLQDTIARSCYSRKLTTCCYFSNLPPPEESESSTGVSRHNGFNISVGMGEDKPSHEINNKGEDKGSKVSMTRAGGRSNNAYTKMRRLDGAFDLIKRIVPWMLLAFLIRWILSFFLFSSSPSYVYYQKSVYESSSYNSASGKVERTRKESFRSNIPSMISGRQLQESMNQEKNVDEAQRRISPYILDPEPDAVFERDLERFFPPSPFDDFFLK